MRQRCFILGIVVAMNLLAANPVRTQENYDVNLQRLGELLGSLHFLRNLCGETGSTWRDFMQELLDAENPEAERRAIIVARFNAGYRSHSEIHLRCDENVQSIINAYTKEGEELARRIVKQYGNQ